MNAYNANDDMDPLALYSFETRVGKGSFGQVFAARQKSDARLVAIKTINLELADDEMSDVQSEIAILQQLVHENVTKYMASFVWNYQLWIVMEYCEAGSCHQLLQAGVLSELQLSVLMRGVLNGLAYLHGQHKLHRDIKAANILLDMAGTPKLADFGVSAQLTGTMAKKNTFVGTPYWMSPEVIKQSGYNASADIWSLGITLIELATGSPPYADLHPMKVLFLIPKNPEPVLSDKYSKHLREFLSLCTQRDPLKRASALTLQKTKFITQYKAKKYNTLCVLIERWQTWKKNRPEEEKKKDLEKEVQNRAALEALEKGVVWNDGEEQVNGWDFGTRAAKTTQVRKREYMQDKENAIHFDFEDGPPKKQVEFNAGAPLSYNRQGTMQAMAQRQQHSHIVSASHDETQRARAAQSKAMFDLNICPSLAAIAQHVQSDASRKLLQNVEQSILSAEQGIPGCTDAFINEVMGRCEFEGSAI